MELLFLGDKYRTEEVEQAFGRILVSVMKELGIVIERNEYLITDGYLLISFLGRYFLVGIPYMNPNCKIKDPSVYIGIDTYRLTENIPAKNVDKILDLCTGSGIQAVFASNFTNKGIAVEINSEAAAIAKFNVILNEMENTITVKTGSLYEPVENMTFDCIYSNPPFIAVPDEIDYPSVGKGGTDGLKIVKKIIEGYNDHLCRNGCGIMIGEAIGNDKEPFLVNVLNDVLEKNFKSDRYIRS